MIQRYRLLARVAFFALFVLAPPLDLFRFDLSVLRARLPDAPETAHHYCNGWMANVPKWWRKERVLWKNALDRGQGTTPLAVAV